MMTRRLTFLVLCSGLLLSAGDSRAQEIFDAIKAGDLAKVKAAVEKDPRALNSLNPYDQTPLIVALQEEKPRSRPISSPAERMSTPGTGPTRLRCPTPSRGA